MSNQFNENMRLNEFTCCFNSGQRVSGLALKLVDRRNTETTFDLEPFGKVDTGACETFTLTDSDSYIKVVEITSDQNGITGITLVSTDAYHIFEGKSQGSRSRLY